MLVAALDAERDAVKATDRDESALTPANYEFLDMSPEDVSLIKMDVRPRRKNVMLINGALFVDDDSSDSCASKASCRNGRHSRAPGPRDSQVPAPRRRSRSREHELDGRRPDRRAPRRFR